MVQFVVISRVAAKVVYYLRTRQIMKLEKNEFLILL